NRQSKEVQKELDLFDEKNMNEFLLRRIKGSRSIMPQKGDVFIVSPKEGLYFYGAVVSDRFNLDLYEGCELFTAVIFKEKAKYIGAKDYSLNFNNIMFPPFIVDLFYWRRGLFYNIGDKITIPEDFNYGFFDVIDYKYCDEYENEIDFTPTHCSVSGVKTIYGVGYEIHREAIFDKTLYEPKK
ncbi:MAG: Imm26 family immunity protein, partial [Eubacteriaceae bacterium]